MTWEIFNTTVVRRDGRHTLDFDLRPFGAQQTEALEFLLTASLTQSDPFGKTVSVTTDASVIISPKLRLALTALESKGISVDVVAKR